MARVSSLVQDILKRAKSPNATQTTGSQNNTSKVVQSGSSSSGSVVKGQSTGTQTQTIHTSGPASVNVQQGVISPGRSSSGSTAPAKAPATKAPATKKKAKPLDGGGGKIPVGGGAEGAPEGAGTDLQTQFDTAFGSFESDIEQQRQYILQDQALDAQERALALQELETQANTARQQFELVRQNIQAQMDEANRQLPISLRDIADQFASQGAFYSGRRGEAQTEVQTQTRLALEGLQRQMRGEQLDQDQRDALENINRQKIAVGGQRDELQTQMDLYNLQNSRDLTPEQLVQGLSAGILSTDQLTQGLQSLGYSPNEAKYLTALAEKQQQGGHLSESQLAASFQAGILNAHDYKAALQGLGYTKSEADIIERTAMALGQGPGATGKAISQSQLETGFRQGLITKDQYVQGLQSLGYSPDQAAFLAASAAQKGPLDAASGGKDIGKSDLDQAYQLGLIKPSSYITGLTNLGYSADEAKGLEAIQAAKKAKAGASGSQGQSLSKDEWKSLYSKGLISKSDLIQGLVSKGYTKDQASAIAATVTVDKSGAGGTAKWPSTIVNNTVIGPNVGAQMGDPTKYLNAHLNSYNDIKTSILTLQSQLGKPPTLSQYVSWFTKQYQLQAKVPVMKDGKPVIENGQQKYRSPTTAEAQKHTAQYALGISLAWYRIYYGGGAKYPYHPPAAPKPDSSGSGLNADDTISIF